MGYNSNNPIIIQIVDDGVQADHEDLAANIDFDLLECNKVFLSTFFE